MEIIERLISTLGPPTFLREVVGSPRTVAVVGRWRHGGGIVDLSGLDTTQLLFNLSGGHVVELRWQDRLLRKTVRAGSVAVVSPDGIARVTIDRPADILQLIIARELIEAAGRDSIEPGLETRDRQTRLQAAAARLVVALTRDRGIGGATPETIVRDIARLLSRAPASSSPRIKGGLAPGARRRVRAVIKDRFGQEPCSLPALGELADAAGLSVHHFGRAFRKEEGETPYALVARRRVDASLALLLEIDAKVGEVADAMGFSSPSHFISAFRQRMGVTPGALRDATHSLA